MIQINMQMPTNCLDCPACNEYLTCAIPVNGRKWGENDVREYGQRRPEWCPLKEQEVVVRCKDCKNAEVIEWLDNAIICKKHSYNGVRPDNFYCADGERNQLAGNSEQGEGHDTI